MTGHPTFFQMKLYIAVMALTVFLIFLGSSHSLAQSDGTPLSNMISERAIGPEDAPIIIEEFSSLSCSHCAKFHNQTLDRLKTEFVDTGKIRIIFHDFPLNRPALYGSMLARCLPETQYYKFLQLLFKTQEQWAFTQDFESRLIQSAKLAGLSETQATQCINNQALQQALITNIQQAQKEHGIRSTPTFILTTKNGKRDVIAGAQPFEVFAEKISGYLSDYPAD